MCGIFKPISGYSKDITARFNEFAENKLIVIDESDDNGKPQYTLLKRLTGQNRITVERKYRDTYEVKNNLNIIILSNSKLPIHVDSYEKPTDEKQNQFFVYELPKSHIEIKQDFSNELLRRFGHYMRTVLRPIFNSLDIDNYRYSIEVPITEEEKNLFNISKTELEGEAESVIRKLMDEYDNPSFEYKLFLQNGYIPADRFSATDKSKSIRIIRELQKRDYLAPDKSEKRSFEGKRLRCYKLGSRWFGELQSEGVGYVGSVGSDESTPPSSTDQTDMFIPM